MIYDMSQKIEFKISYEDGIYTASASGKNYAIITDGKDFEELKKNIQEAVSLYLEGDYNNLIKSDEPVSLVGNFEIPFPV
jgi:predicted RNase H-like HicB family nuclease